MRFWQRFVFALCLCLASQATAGEIPLTLHDALVRTTEKTLDLQIDRLTPQQSFQDYRKSQGIFDTNLTLSLDEYIIEGIKTTIFFHKRIMTNKDFIDGNVDTSFLEKLVFE